MCIRDSRYSLHRRDRYLPCLYRLLPLYGKRPQALLSIPCLLYTSILVRSWYMIRPAPIFICPTSEFPICPSGSPTAVSYTHLDVYKRQPLSQQTPTISWANALLITTAPVSYTHLDVYKRQLIRYPLIISSPQYGHFMPLHLLQIPIEISPILRTLITVIFCY